MTLDIPENKTIDPNTYIATVKKIETKEIEKGAYAGDTIRIWTFDVDGEPISGSSSLAFGPASKSYRWFEAIMGRPPIFGEKSVPIIGRQCSVKVIVDDRGYNKVTDVYPYLGAQKGVESVSTPPSTEAADPDWLPPMEEPPLYEKSDLP